MCSKIIINLVKFFFALRRAFTNDKCYDQKSRSLSPYVYTSLKNDLMRMLTKLVFETP